MPRPDREDMIVTKIEAEGKEVEDELARLIEKHRNLSSIAEIFSVTPKAVQKHMRNIGYVCDWHQVPDDKVFGKYMESKDVVETANHFRVTEGYVRSVLIKKLNAVESNE